MYSDTQSFTAGTVHKLLKQGKTKGIATMKENTCESCTYLRGFTCDRLNRPTPFPDKEYCDHWKEGKKPKGEKIWGNGSRHCKAKLKE